MTNTQQLQEKNIPDPIIEQFIEDKHVPTLKTAPINISLCTKCNCMTHKVCGKCAALELSTAIESAKQVERERTFKNVGSWHKVPVIDSDTNSCVTCGHEGVLVRGRYPGTDNRYTCPVCCLEIIESILDSCNNREAKQDTLTPQSTEENT